MSDPVTRLNAALESRYAIERELGEGGMATVYLAEDLKHNRKVALKVLKPELAAVVGAERFLAEIKVTANLQHPHILPLFDSGEADSFLFYVMPYVEGESLRDRLDREKQLPVDEAVRIATAVANALDHAHRHKVIHRDIKPANILLQDGEPVVADFGIALAVGAAGSSRLTETGLSLGTPYYMSPEQATGDQPVGASTDTYALGSVLYEMLVGEPPYPGTTAQAVLGKIIVGKPVSATEQRPAIPANVDAALRKALEKLPADRFTSAQDFVRALGDEHFRYGEAVAGVADEGGGPWNRVSIAMTALAAVSTLTLGWSLLRTDPPEPPGPVTRVSVLMGEDQSFHPGRGELDLSTDGSLMVSRGRGDEGQAQLWLRRWDALEATPVRNTDGASYQAISPDGREVAFGASGSIRVVPLEGGVSRTLTDSAFCCPSWSPEGDWVYYSNLSRGLSRVPASGGPSEVVTQLDTAAGTASMCSRMHCRVAGSSCIRRRRRIRRTKESKPWTWNPVKSRTSRRARPRATAPPGICSSWTRTRAPFWLPPSTRRTWNLQARRCQWRKECCETSTDPRSGTYPHRAGLSTGRARAPRATSRPCGWSVTEPSERSILDGSFAATITFPALRFPPTAPGSSTSITDSDRTTDLWVKQLDTGPLFRLTFEGTENLRALWSRDGQFVTFVSNRAGQRDLWRKKADGSGPAELVLDRERPIQEFAYTPDGTWLVFVESDGGTANADIYGIRPGVDSVATALVTEGSSASEMSLSPDGRWLAYTWQQEGGIHVYVRPFPDVDAGRWQISTTRGDEAVWAHNGRELFYQETANADVQMVAEIIVDPSFAVGEQRVLFPLATYLIGNGHAQYDINSDDQRLVMLNAGELDSQLILVVNFFEELKERVGN